MVLVWRSSLEVFEGQRGWSPENSWLLWSGCHCSVAESCLTLCDPMGSSMPDFPNLHFLYAFAQIHVH